MPAAPAVTDPAGLPAVAVAGDILPGELWWPLACASARHAHPIFGPGCLLRTPAPVRAEGAALLAGVAHDDALWDRYAADRSALVRAAVATLAAPERVFDKLARDGSADVLAALAANRHTPAEALVAIRLPTRDTAQVIVSLVRNPAFAAARLGSEPMFTTTDLLDGLGTAIQRHYERVFGSAVWSCPQVDLVRAWLGNPATRGSDIATAFEHQRPGIHLHSVVSAPSAPPHLLAAYAAELVDAAPTGSPQILAAIGRHHATPPDVLALLAGNRHHLRYVAAHPRLPTAAFARLLGSVPATGAVPDELLPLFTSPHMSRDTALRFLATAAAPLANAIFANPNVTTGDVLAAPSDLAPTVALHLMRSRHWLALSGSANAWQVSPEVTALLGAPTGTPPVPQPSLAALLSLATAGLTPAAAVAATQLL